MTNYVTAAGVQQFSISFAANAATGIATINPVGSGAFIIFNGNAPTVASDPSKFFSYLTLTNATTITATRNTADISGSETGTVYGCIVDASTVNLVKSVQYGTVSISGGSSSGTSTITSVTNSNTAIHLLGWKSSNTTYSGINENPILSLSGTTVTANRTGTSGSLTVGFVVIEFQGACLNQSVQQISATNSTNVASYTASFSSVNLDNTITFFGGHSVASETTDLSTILQSGELTSSTQLTVSLYTASANTKKYNCSVVEFKAGVLKSAVQRGTNTFTNAGTPIALTTAVDFLNAGSLRLGESTDATTTSSGELSAILSSYITNPVVTPGPAVSIISSSGGSSFPVSIFTSPPTSAGDLLVVAIAIQGPGSSSISGLVDDQSQVYTHIAAADASSSAGSGVQTKFYYFQNCAASLSTITINGTGTFTNMNVTVYDIYGMPISGSVADGIAVTNNGSSSAIFAPATINTSTPYDVLITAACGESTTGQNLVNFFFYQSDNDFSAYAVLPNTGQTPVCELGTGSGLADTWCASAVALFADLVNFPASYTSQITTTPIINPSPQQVTTSYEVFEFSAFILVSLQALSAIQTKVRGLISVAAPLSAKTGIQVKNISMPLLTSLLSAASSIKTMLKGKNTSNIFLFSKSAAHIKSHGIDIFSKFLNSISNISIRMRGVLRITSNSSLFCCKPIEDANPDAMPTESGIPQNNPVEKSVSVNSNPIEGGNNSCGC